MEELQRALEERGLILSTVPGKGRRLFTTKDVSPGPHFVELRRIVKLLFKLTWGFKNLKLHPKSNWKVHQLECQALARLESDKRKSVTPAIRLMLKLYIRRKLQTKKMITTTATDSYQLMEALVAHMSEIDEKQLVLYVQMANLVNLILQWTGINIREIAENFSKLSCNAQTICGSELRPLATGLYPVISIINHSCLPNAVLIFEGRVAVVRAVQHIPKGYEVSIIYIETPGSTLTRQKALKDQYFFTCTCQCCALLGQADDMQESAVLEGYRCKDDKCCGSLLRDSKNREFLCQSCGLPRDKEELKQIATEIRTLNDRALTTTTSGQSISIYKELEKLQEKLYHPCAIPLLQTREKLLKMLMEMENWKEALAYCRLTIPIYERVYTNIHPLLGLQYYTCGKLEWLLGDAESAVKSLSNAVDILRVTHGASTPFVKELILKLDEARAELSYKLMNTD